MSSRSGQLQIGKTKNIRHKNIYVQSMYEEFKDLAFDEISSEQWKGQWRKDVFKTKPSNPLHLEIGPGSGKHFSKLCSQNPKESFLAIELKYKPLIQTLQKVKKQNCKNGRALRYNARLIENLFSEGEINNIYIHFPDPWSKKRQQKHRLINQDFTKSLYKIQKTNSLIDFKTDSRDYFLKSVEMLKKTGYKLITYTEDLYKEKEEICLDDLSQFELIFYKKKEPIHHAIFNKQIISERDHL